MHLVDVRNLFPGLKCKPGVTSWTPMNTVGEFFKKFEDVPPKWDSQIHADLFPPTEEEAKKFQLEKW